MQNNWKQSAVLQMPWWDLMSWPAFSATDGAPEQDICPPLHGIDVPASASGFGWSTDVGFSFWGFLSPCLFCSRYSNSFEGKMHWAVEKPWTDKIRDVIYSDCLTWDFYCCHSPWGLFSATGMSLLMSMVSALFSSAISSWFWSTSVFLCNGKGHANEVHFVNEVMSRHCDLWP